MRVKKDIDKSPVSELKEVPFWRISLKRSMEKKIKKSDRKSNSYFISYANGNHDEGASSRSFESDTDSLYDNGSIKSEANEPDKLKIAIKQLDILAFESEDEEISDDEDAFTSFSKLNLEYNLAHLSVFLNFAISHAIAEPILFYLITNIYANGSIKEMKIWAYEIYSSFLAPFSLLKVLDTKEHETLIKDIEKKLEQISLYNPVHEKSSSYNCEMNRHLRNIFIQARIEVEEIIKKQLEAFQNKRRAGLDAMYGAGSIELKASKMCQKKQQSVIERNLMPNFLKMQEHVEENDINHTKSILLSALTTVIVKTFNVTPSLLIESVNQFVSATNPYEMEFTVNGHRFIPKVCYSPIICDFCSTNLVGISPQGYECDCGIKIHNDCIHKLTGMCILHKDESEDESKWNMSKDLSKFMDQFVLGNKHIENYKRNKGDRSKSDPGVYSVANSPQIIESEDSDLDSIHWSFSDGTPDAKKISEDERKLKDVMMELFETERRHVKILSVLENIFLKPLTRSMALSSELADLLFPSSFFMIRDWHISFEAILRKEWQEQNRNLLEVGNCLIIFDEQYANILKENVASFCAGQKRAFEQLRIARIKNENLQKGLLRAESHKRCKRLQLKDLMLSILHRITKYPLLFERMLKYAKETEREKIRAAFETSKSILGYVNHVVKSAEELESIQTKLDKSYFNKECLLEYRNLNLNDHKLIHDGYLLMKKCPKLNRVLLLEKYLVVLHMQDDKYLLKPCESMKLPIVKLHSAIIRSNAIDNRSFFVISQTNNDSQMLEFYSLDNTGCNLWIENISKAIDKAKQRIALKRKPSAESAQSMLRQENKINLPIKKQSELATMTQALASQADHIEDWIESAQNCLKMDTQNGEFSDKNNINACINTLKCLISQLTIKIAERDHERELLYKENQRLKEQNKFN